MTYPTIKIKATIQPTIKGKMDVRFPANVEVLSPVLLDKSGGNYTFSLDMDAIIANLSNGIFQPLDSDLTAIAALTTTTYGRSLLTLANATALAAEVDSFFLTPAEGNAAYQPLDSDLTAIAALTTTSYGRAFLALADAAAARTALSLGTAATQNTGTSGANVPLMNGANTWATTQTYTVAPVFTDQSGTRTALGLTIGTNVQAYDADLAALAANSTDGLWAHTGSGTGAARTLTAPAAGLTISNPAGIAGNPTFALANDLSALEGLASTGIAARTATDTWAQRTITGTANEITITNGDGVSGNPTASLPAAITLTGKTMTGGTFTDPLIARVIGGTGTGSSIDLQSTSGVGATDYIRALVGNNGATEAWRTTTSGQFLVGTTAAYAVLSEAAGAFTPTVQIHAVGAASTASITRWSNDNAGGRIAFAKSRGGAIGTMGIVQSTTPLGSFLFNGDDGTNFVAAAMIQASIDGTPGTNDMPGKITLHTTADGTNVTTERLRIDNTGAVSHRAAATVVIDANSHLGLRSYTVGTLPSASTSARLIYVSDGTSNKRLGVSDGTNWRWPDGAIVS